MTENRRRVSVGIDGQQRAVSIRSPAQAGGRTVTVTALPVRMGRRAETAERLETPRLIAITGSANGDTLFDGSEDVQIHTVIETMSNSEIEALLAQADGD